MEALELWFLSEKGAVAGMAEWDAQQVKDVITTNGGQCHQLGNGPWMVQRVIVRADGEYGGCGCRLTCFDAALTSCFLKHLLDE